MAHPLRPIETSLERRITRLEEQTDRTYEILASVREDVSEMRTSATELRVRTEEFSERMSKGFDRINATLKEMTDDLNSRVGNVEKEQSKWKLKLAAASGAIIAAGAFVGGWAGKLLGLLAGIF